MTNNNTAVLIKTQIVVLIRMESNFKQFLHAFCGKRKAQPEYIYEEEDGGFYCEVRVPGFDFIGCGDGRSKKDAQGLAAKSFAQFLVDQHLVPASAIVSLAVNEPDEGASTAPHPAPGNLHSPVPLVSQRPPVQQWFPQRPPVQQWSPQRPPPPQRPPSSPQPLFPTPLQSPPQPRPLMQPLQHLAAPAACPQRQGSNSYRVDPVDSAHLGTKRAFEDMDRDNDTGNWTLEVAKSRLHLFLQTTRQPKDMQVKPVGPDHQRTFTAEMTVYVPSLHRTIRATEHASTKKQVTNALALNLVVQLYKLGAIEAARPPGAKKASEQVDLREVKIPDDIMGDLKTLLTDLNITPVPPPSEEMSGEPVSVLLPLPRPEKDPGLGERGGVVDWRPPHIDWDPWTFRSAYQAAGPYSQLEPEERAKRLSFDLKEEYEARKQRDPLLQKSLQERYSLPIASVSEHIVSAICSNQVVIIRGNTGCGKTTQVPQYILDSILESGHGATCNIVVTQPRRISAISVSERVAQERGEELGHICGYSVRFESVLPRHYASILFCTVGVLLRKLEAGLAGISHIVVDEIHERDLNSDFLLVVLRDMLGMYPELRVVLMSATIDTSLFSRYFNNCPIIEVVGKTYPVEEYFLEDAVELVHFIPPPSEKKKKREVEDEDEDENLNLVCDASRYSLTTQHALSQLNEKEIPFELIEALLHHFKTMNMPGAVLIFLPGWNSIFSLHRHLGNHPVFGSRQYWLLPCHSQVPRDEQRKVFAVPPDGVTKIIMATNIAETSITINDVVFVIDSARAKVKMFTAHNNMTNYATVWASKTNLEQRSGRAGRVRPGCCFHLCSRARYERLPKYLTPEILRTPLHELALTIKLLGLGEIGTFLAKAMEPPPAERVTEAVVLLHEMEALDVNEQLTPLGTILARLPIEPRMGKMIVLGCVCGVGDAICTIAACTCFPEPFLTQPGHKRLSFIHKKFAGQRASDHLAMLTAFHQWERVSEDEQAEWSFCETNLLAQHSMRMAAEARNQLKGLLIGAGFPEECLSPYPLRVTGDDERADMVVALLCVGLYPNVCFHKEKRQLLISEGKRALIHKTSVNNITKDPKFMSPYFVFGEKLKTRAVSAKCMTMVEPIHLLLFGSSSVVSHGNNIVKLDDWIPLTMSHTEAALIGCFRQTVDDLLVRMATDPTLVMHPPPRDEAIIRTLSALVCIKSASPGDTSQPTQRGFHAGPRGTFRGGPHYLAGRGRGGGPGHQFGNRGRRGQGTWLPRGSHPARGYGHRPPFNRGRGW